MVKLPCKFKQLWLVLVLYLFCILLGCSPSAIVNGATAGNGYPSDYTVAVIQTTRQMASTYIDYYDENLNLITSLEYPYKTTQSPWGKPCIYDGKVYMTPQGTGLALTTSVVAELDLNTGKVHELDADGGVTNVSANDDYIFAAARGGMGRIDKTTGEVLSIDQPGRMFPFAYEDRVYAFNDERELGVDENSHLLIYSEDMELLEDIDFGSGAHIPTPSGFIEDKLYFVSAYDDGSTPWEDIEWNLSYYSVSDAQIHVVTTVTGMSIDYVESIGDKLYVRAVGDTSGDIADKILVINKETGNIDGVCPMEDFVPQYLYVVNNVLYVGGANFDRSHSLRSYIPDGEDLRQSGEILLSSHTTDGSARYYIGGLFANK